MIGKTEMHIGYGFSVFELTFSKMIAFLEKHGGDQELIDYLKVESQADYEEIRWLEDPEVDDVSKISGFGGIEAAIANIIYKEQGISVGYYPQDDNQSTYVIMLEYLPPWFATEKDKALTKEGLVDIFTPYIEELGLSAYSLNEYALEYFY